LVRVSRVETRPVRLPTDVGGFFREGDSTRLVAIEIVVWRSGSFASPLAFSERFSRVK